MASIIQAISINHTSIIQAFSSGIFKADSASMLSGSCPGEDLHAAVLAFAS